jgi:hypothetical protein
LIDRAHFGRRPRSSSGPAEFHSRDNGGKPPRPAVPGGSPGLMRHDETSDSLPFARASDAMRQGQRETDRGKDRYCCTGEGGDRDHRELLGRAENKTEPVALSRLHRLIPRPNLPLPFRPSRSAPRKENRSPLPLPGCQVPLVCRRLRGPRSSRLLTASRRTPAEGSHGLQLPLVFSKGIAAAAPLPGLMREADL